MRIRMLTHVAMYALAIAAAVIVGLVAPDRLSLEARLLIATGTVTLAAWVGGLGPGVVATLVIGGLALELARRDPASAARAGFVLLFVLEGLAISVVAGLRQRADRRNRERVRRHAAIAVLGRRNLGVAELAPFLDDAARLVVRTLGVDWVEITETASRPGALRVRVNREAVAGAPAPRPPRSRSHRQRPPLAIRSNGHSVSMTFMEPRSRRGSRERHTSVPVEGEIGTLGHLDVSSSRPLSREDREFLEAVAHALAAGIHRAHADAEAARLKSRGLLMAEIGAIASAPLDLTTRVGDLARVVVPRIADACAIDLVTDSGELRRIAVEPRGSLVGLGADPSEASSGILVAAADPAAVAARGGITQLVSRIEDEDLRRIAMDGPQLERLRRLGLGSLLSVPLSARGRTLGVITLATTSRPGYGATDLAMAEELAARAALALDSARLHEQLVAEDRAKGEFLSQLGHELRNPLGPIVHSLEVFQAASPDSESHQRARRVLARQVGQLRHLVRDLLDVARVTHGTIELHREPVELMAAVTEALESCESVLEAHRHELVHHAPSTPVWIEADSVRLEQILTNLIHNAVENSRPGARTDLSVEPEAEGAVVRVRGEGAAAGWSRVLALRAGEGEGDDATSIGLHLSKRLVELHGGAIEARRSGDGMGELVVRLPLAAAAAPTPSGETTGARDGSMSPLRVLVVDDHLDSAAALAELMALWGHEVRSAIDGREALRIAESFHPELVLLDLAMPDMNGYQLAAELRRHPESSEATMVAITGQERERGREQAAGVEFDYHWIKPLDVPAFRAFIAERARQRHQACAS